MLSIWNVVDRQVKRALMVAVATPRDRNIRKKEHKTLKKYSKIPRVERGARKCLESSKGSVVLVVIGALKAVTSKPWVWLRCIL